MRLIAAVLTLLALAPAARADEVLLMLDAPGCHWCQRWDAEVGVVYDKTAEGRAAPLRRHDIHAPLPKGVILVKKAHYTPTFVLLKDGAEVGRIEGYPGEDFFYGLLQNLLKKADRTTGGGA